MYQTGEIALDVRSAVAPHPTSTWTSLMVISGLCTCMGFAVAQHLGAQHTSAYATPGIGTQRSTSQVAQWRPAQRSLVAHPIPATALNVQRNPLPATAQSGPHPSTAPFSVLFALPIVAAGIAILHRFFPKRQPEVAMAATVGKTVEYSTIQFPPLKNDRLLRTIRGEPVDRIPVWVMRQAGRYLPEYRQFMADKSFFQVCRNPKQVAELTLQPILRYDLDGSIIFSDILVIPQAMGCSIALLPDKGPVFEEPVDSKAAWAKLQDRMLEQVGVKVSPNTSSADKNKLLVDNVAKLVSPSLDYVYAAITETRMQLEGRVPLLGFCGAPMTLAIYMIEGGGSRTFAKTSSLFHGDPETSHQMLTVLAHMCAHYLMNQVRAGAQALQVFDSFAGALSPGVWDEYSFPYLKLIAELVKKEFPEMPMLCFAKDAHYGFDRLTTTKYDVIALDSSMDLGKCHKVLAPMGKGVQGNIDTTILYAPPERITEVVTQELQKAFGGLPALPTRYIANMGHGMNPDHNPEHLRAFIDAIHAFRTK